MNTTYTPLWMLVQSQQQPPTDDRSYVRAIIQGCVNHTYVDNFSRCKTIPTTVCSGGQKTIFISAQIHHTDAHDLFQWRGAPVFVSVWETPWGIVLSSVYYGGECTLWNIGNQTKIKFFLKPNLICNDDPCKFIPPFCWQGCHFSDLNMVATQFHKRKFWTFQDFFQHILAIYSGHQRQKSKDISGQFSRYGQSIRTQKQIFSGHISNLAKTISRPS